ncbi:hypothetical protein [Ruegeria sp. HKCCD8929]|uniref:hypothetical protein n=1 Tax=Ruegeria sp. HKCCD8929 TaxID=2683006 RepID=UPI00148846D1|nr:hypothetical protein [Ruegeria sp. HKCCD8929]
MLAESPTCEFTFFAASARSAKIAASAQSTALRGGGDSRRSFILQRSFGEEFTGRGTWLPFIFSAQAFGMPSDRLKAGSL